MKIDTDFEYDKYSVRTKVLKQTTFVINESLMSATIGIMTYHQIIPIITLGKHAKYTADKKKLSKMNYLQKFFNRLFFPGKYIMEDPLNEVKEQLIEKLCNNYYQDLELSKKTNPKHEIDYAEEYSK